MNEMSNNFQVYAIHGEVKGKGRTPNLNILRKTNTPPIKKLTKYQNKFVLNFFSFELNYQITPFLPQTILHKFVGIL